MKRLLQLFFLALLGLGPTGQVCSQPTQLSALSGMAAPSKAISRQYNGEESIYYYDDGASHYFVLQNVGDPDNAVIATFPSDYDVLDFEVYRDSVYFCGSHPNGGNPFGMVGFIGVADLFYNNGPYNICDVQNLMADHDLLAEHIVSFDRMDVFEDADVHFAVVGEMAQDSDLRRVFADIWYVSGGWTGDVVYDKDGLYVPTDITCTEDAVVVGAYDELLDGPVLLVYSKVANFPSAPLYPHLFRIKDPKLIYDNVLVERLQGNDVAVTNLFKDYDTGEEGIALHYVADVTSLLSIGYP